MKQPKTSDEIALMFRSGKTVDAAVRRAVRQAIGKPAKPAKPKPRAKPSSRRTRGKAA